MTENIDEDTLEMLEYPLKHYIRGVFRDIINFKKTILQREQIDTNIWKYTVPERDIYLDSEGYAVTYGRQKVENGKVYYRFTDELGVPDDMAYEYVADYEWKKTKQNWME